MTWRRRLALAPVGTQVALVLRLCERAVRNAADPELREAIAVARVEVGLRLAGSSGGEMQRPLGSLLERDGGNVASSAADQVMALRVGLKVLDSLLGLAGGGRRRGDRVFDSFFRELIDSGAETPESLIATADAVLDGLVPLTHGDPPAPPTLAEQTPSHGHLRCSGLEVARVSQVRDENGRWRARFDLPQTETRGLGQVIDFVRFSQEWNERNAQRAGGDVPASDFANYRGLVGDGCWTFHTPTGAAARIDWAPSFFGSSEVTWRHVLAHPMALALEAYWRTGDARRVHAAISSQPARCHYEYPSLHRIRDLQIDGEWYRLTRCAACGEELWLDPISSSWASEEEGVPLWLVGERLQQWVEEEEAFPSDEATDWERWRS